MAVQPTTTNIEEALGAVEANNGVSATINEQTNVLQPVSPTDVAFESALRAALEEAPAAASSLADATVALNDLGSQYPHNLAFDPAGDFAINFNPNEGDDERWDAQDFETAINADVDWDSMLTF